MGPIGLPALTARNIVEGVTAFVLSALLSLALVAYVVSALSQDHFTRAETVWLKQRPFWQRAIGYALKNICGYALIAIGILLSVPGVPGQGVLTMVIGLMLVDFPRKRTVEKRIVRVPFILKSLNRLRVRLNRPPFETPSTD